MSKRTHKRTQKRVLRFQYVGAAGVGGFHIAHPQRDSVVAAMVAEFGEERAEALLRGAEDERVSFITYLWNKKLLAPAELTELWQSVETRTALQEADASKAFESGHGRTMTPRMLSPAEGEERRRVWEKERAEGRVTSGVSLEPAFDPCFRPGIWPWHAESARTRKTPAGGWCPNSAEIGAAMPAQTVERDSSVFPVEANFLFELRDAKNNAGTFEKERVRPAEKAAKAWEHGEDADALAGATLYFNLGTRLCALGAARSDNAAIARAAESFRKAKTAAAAAKKGDPVLAAKIQHSLGYALFTAAETTEEFQASAEASNEAAEIYAGTDDPKRCGHARFNLALALTAVANRTGRVSDLTSAAGAFAQAAEIYAAAAEPQESASALHRQGLIQLELGRRTGDAEAFQEAAAVSAEAAKRFVAVDDVRTSAAARDNQTIALTEAGDFEAAAEAAAEAAVRHAESGNTLGCAHAKFREGHALSELARAAEGSEPLQRAVEALASAERRYVESGSERDLASALHNQGVCLLELGDRTGDSNAYRDSAAIFVRATKSHLEVGNKENGAVTEYYRGVALLNYAALQEEHPAFRQSAEASAAAASIAEESPGGEEWYANARYNQGTAILELAKRTDSDADFQEAAAVLEEAARCLRGVEHTERGAEAEAARELALTTLRERGASAKFDSASSSVARSNKGVASTGEGTREIGQETDAATAPSALREEFAGASRDELLLEIARLRGAKAPTKTSARGTRDLISATLDELVGTLPEKEKRPCVPPVGLVARLTALVVEAQQSPPTNRRAFAQGVNELLDGYSLRFQLPDKALARLVVSGSSRAGSLQFGATGGNRSFKKPPVVIVPITMQPQGLQPQYLEI